MTDIIQVLFWPFLACLVLTGIHAYLGFHVVERGVIFVDLSLAQLAALGATVAYLAGLDIHGRGGYIFSLGFTLAGAAVFTMTRLKKSRIPQEAIIGIVYAVSAAAAILIMDRSPEGAEHIKYTLVGNLLAVGKHDVAKMAALYALIGILHWQWRKQLLLISTDPDRAAESGYSIKTWDFVFYSTFGVVVTSSVPVAGVLLVFSYLIIPSVTAMMFSERVVVRLAIGWGMGALVSLLGMYASFKFDAPTGAMVIFIFGAALLLLAAVRLLSGRGRQRPALF